MIGGNQRATENWTPAKKLEGAGLGAICFGADYDFVVCAYQSIVGRQLPVEIYH